MQLPAGSNPSIQPGPGEFQQHTFLFGPEFCVLKTGRMAVHLRALAGAAHRNTLAAPLSEAGQSPPPLIGDPAPPITQLAVHGGTGFAAGSTQPDFRAATGLVFRLGRR